MSNRKKQLQLQIDIPARDEVFPVYSAIQFNGIRIGDLPGAPSTVGPKKSPCYADVGHETMTPELIMQYRARIASGVYDAPASIHALAEALLASCDL